MDPPSKLLGDAMWIPFIVGPIASLAYLLKEGAMTAKAITRECVITPVLLLAGFTVWPVAFAAIGGFDVGEYYKALDYGDDVPSLFIFAFVPFVLVQSARSAWSASRTWIKESE